MSSDLSASEQSHVSEARFIHSGARKQVMTGSSEGSEHSYHCAVPIRCCLRAHKGQVSVGPRLGCLTPVPPPAQTSVRILQKRWDWLHAAVRARAEHCGGTAMRAYGWLCVPSIVERCRSVSLFSAFEAGARFGVVAGHARPHNGRSGTDG